MGDQIALKKLMFSEVEKSWQKHLADLESVLGWVSGTCSCQAMLMGLGKD